MSQPTADELVAEFGEVYRVLIEDALAFLDEREPHWGVRLNRREYIADLVSRSNIVLTAS